MSLAFRWRREALLDWMSARAHSGLPLTKHTIGALSGFYDTAEPRIYNGAMVERDLKALEKQGRIRRVSSRPARWEVMR